MASGFDPGYEAEPFRSLCREYPGPEVYPPEDFRVEWGPVFHRGRLDGSARVLVVGQDPAVHEVIVRRVLVGEAGQRVQGFLAKLGSERDYVMVNAFLYGTCGQRGAEAHMHDAEIAAYRNAWLDALLVGGEIKAVVAFGRHANNAFEAWRATPAGRDRDIVHVHVIHATQPDTAAPKGSSKREAARKKMLDDWNRALEILGPVLCPGDRVDRYGDVLEPADLAPIPAADLPPGLPVWMGAREQWARRVGDTVEAKRAAIEVTVPDAHRF